MERTLNFDADNKRDHTAYILFVIAACTKGQWAWLIKISFVRFLMMYSALSHLLMVTFSSICKICGKRLNKNCLSWQAVCIMLVMYELPKAFRNIRRLERVLRAKCFLFIKVSILWEWNCFSKYSMLKWIYLNSNWWNSYLWYTLLRTKPSALISYWIS